MPRRNPLTLQSLAAMQVLLQFMRLSRYAIMQERLGALVRIMSQIFLVGALPGWGGGLHVQGDGSPLAARVMQFF